MTDEQLLTMLKIDIGFTSSGATKIDTRLTQLLQAAEKFIISEGATTYGTSSSPSFRTGAVAERHFHPVDNLKRSFRPC